MHRPRVWCSGVGLGRQSADFPAINMHRPRVCWSGVVLGRNRPYFRPLTCIGRACAVVVGPVASLAGVRKPLPARRVKGGSELSATVLSNLGFVPEISVTGPSKGIGG
jgi:hypothetical protein